jgi:hypothetical protein
VTIAVRDRISLCFTMFQPYHPKSNGVPGLRSNTFGGIAQRLLFFFFFFFQRLFAKTRMSSSSAKATPAAAAASSSAAPAASSTAGKEQLKPLFPVTPDWSKVPLHERIVIDAARK